MLTDREVVAAWPDKDVRKLVLVEVAGVLYRRVDGEWEPYPPYPEPRDQDRPS